MVCRVVRDDDARGLTKRVAQYGDSLDTGTLLYDAFDLSDVYSVSTNLYIHMDINVN